MMESDEENESRAVWCVVATFRPESASERSGLRFEQGATVYCLPPNVSGAYETVKVIGPDRRSGKFGTALVPARDLADWRAAPVRDEAILPHISPPWDGTEVSRHAARGIAAWKSGGPWPTAELRLWNRSHAQTQTGPDSLFGRLRQVVTRALGRDET